MSSLYSLQDAGFHCEFEDFMALLEHLVLQSPVIDWQLSVLENEFLHNVAVVHVYGKDLCEADEHIVLDSVFWVNEGRELLREVDRLLHRDLSCLFLVLLEEESKCIDDLRPWGPVRVQARTVLQHCIVLAQFGEEIVKWLDSASSENLIQDIDLC